MGYMTTSLCSFHLTQLWLSWFWYHIYWFLNFLNFLPLLSRCNWHIALYKLKRYSIITLYLASIFVTKFIKNTMTTSYYWQPEIFLKWKNKIDIQMFKNIFFLVWPIAVWFLINCSLTIYFFFLNFLLSGNRIFVSFGFALYWYLKSETPETKSEI